MTKFDKVNKELLEKTYNTDNYIRLVRGSRDARDAKRGYHTVNVVTNNTVDYYRTLNRVIVEYKLIIK